MKDMLKRECIVFKTVYCTSDIILYCRIDDIQDNSTLRRGIPVAHSIYGVASTISAANYSLLKQLNKLHNLNHPEAITVCTEYLMDVYCGQGMEIFWRENYTCPSFEEYKQMVQKSKYSTKL
jgi:geranylgeranyl diphosphate synthase type 3